MASRSGQNIDYAALREAERDVVKKMFGFVEPVIGQQRIVYAELEKPKKGRYGNVAKRTEYNGVMYDSKAEAAEAMRLDVAGHIAWWLRQVWIPLGPDFGTRVDFLVGEKWPPNPKIILVHATEVKGVETREFKKVRKLWPKYAPFGLRIVKKGDVEILEGKQ